MFRSIICRVLKSFLLGTQTEFQLLYRSVAFVSSSYLYLWPKQKLKDPGTPEYFSHFEAPSFSKGILFLMVHGRSRSRFVTEIKYVFLTKLYEIVYQKGQSVCKDVSLKF